jgi:hypothetical protein
MGCGGGAQLETLSRLWVVHISAPLAGQRHSDHRMHGNEPDGSPIPGSLVGRKKKTVAGAVAGTGLFAPEAKVGTSLSRMIRHFW